MRPFTFISITTSLGMQARYQAHLVDRNVVTDACHDILENTTSGHVEQQVIGDDVLRATTPSHPSTWRTCSRYPRALTRAGGIALRRDFSLDELAYQCPGEVTIPGLTGQHVHCGHKARAEVRFRAGRFLPPPLNERWKQDYDPGREGTRPAIGRSGFVFLNGQSAPSRYRS
jgi:hypothetical protein